MALQFLLVRFGTFFLWRSFLCPGINIVIHTDWGQFRLLRQIDHRSHDLRPQMHEVVYPLYPQALQTCTDDTNDHASVFDTSKAHFRTLFLQQMQQMFKFKSCQFSIFNWISMLFQVPFPFSIHGHYAVCKLKRIQGHVLRPGFLDMTSWSAPWSKQFLVGVNMVILNVGDLACNISDMNIMNQWQQKRGVCGNGSASPSSNLFHPFPP